ncbi:MAG: SCO family protein [Planctomycetota bacterium]
MAIVLLAGGLLLIVPQLVGRSREAATIAETKILGVEKDKSFPSTEDWLTKYTLTERSGKQFNSETLAGKVQVVNFFFTSCPVACPLQTAKVQELDREFGPRGVHFLSITCDPDNDTPAVLSRYAKKYDADPERWVFLTGDFTYIRKVAGEVYLSPLEKGFHREDFVVVDKWGKVRGSFLWNHPEEIVKMKALLTTLLAEQEPPPEALPDVEPVANDSDTGEEATASTEE